MKKIISLILCFLVFSVSLCGCSSSVDNIILSTNAYEMKVDETYTISYTIYPSNLQKTKLEWKSSNEAIATVNQEGVVTAISSGQVNISAVSSNGVVAVCSITVLEKPAYDRLTVFEKELVNTVLEHIDSFKNPNSVVIKAVQNNGEASWIVKISAQNGFGGNSISVYYLDQSLGFWNWDSFDIDLDVSITPDSSYNIELINEAIAEKI